MTENVDLAGMTIEVRAVKWHWWGLLLTPALVGLLYWVCWMVIGDIPWPVASLIGVFAIVFPSWLTLSPLVLVRLTPHGIAVSSPRRIRRFATLGPLIGWDQIEEVVAGPKGVELRGPGLEVRIACMGLGIIQTDLLADRVQEALKRYRDLERGPGAGRACLEAGLAHRRAEVRQ